MFVADAHAAAIGDDVLRLKLAVDLLFVDAKLRQALPRNFEEDHLLLLAEQIHLLDVRHQQQLAAQELGVAAKLGLREPLAGNRQEDAVNVAEIVDHHRLAANRGWQLGLHVVDLAAKFVPDLRDSVLVDIDPG